MNKLTVNDVKLLPFDYLPILLNERQEKIEEQAAEIEELKEVIGKQNDRIMELDRLTIELAGQMDPEGE